MNNATDTNRNDAPGAPGGAGAPSITKTQRRFGRGLGGLLTLFFLVDGGMKIARQADAVETTVQLGYPDGAVVGIGLVLVVCAVLYAIPRTALVGAVLLTAYLGGAVATHVRVGGPAFNVTLPIIFGALVWCSLGLRDLRVRYLLGPDAHASAAPRHPHSKEVAS